jgi:hypothetical protein
MAMRGSTTDDDDSYGVTMKNNVIAFNGGTGVREREVSFSRDYNLYWQNSGGNYSGFSPGATCIERIGGQWAGYQEASPAPLAVSVQNSPVAAL